MNEVTYEAAGQTLYEYKRERYPKHYPTWDKLPIGVQMNWCEEAKPIFEKAGIKIVAAS